MSPEERALAEAVGRVLTAMAHVGSALALLAAVWAGFVLMAEGAGDRGGRAAGALASAVVGLALVLSARGVAALLRGGVVPVPSP